MTRQSEGGTAITLVDCAKTFPDGTCALEPISLSIEASETVVLLGPSGCGKTTTLRIIAGLEEPDRGGQVRFGQDDVTALPIERRNVGMVFQSYALFPNMTVEQNIAYGLKVRKLPQGQIATRVAEMLEMMRIGDLKTRSIDQLSGGQRQRVALARAIAVRPRVLLLDEPLTALDALLRERLRVEINLLLRQLSITAVYVTHDQAEAMALGDRIVVMNQGRIAQIGPPREIYFTPADAFVADFIGTMNRIVGERKGDAIETRGGRIPWQGGGSGPVEVSFRPGAVRLANGEDAPLKGRIAAAFFLGEKTRLIVEGAAEGLIVVETTGQREYSEGESVGLIIDPSAIITLNE